jgi:hypothetical protein
VSLEVSITNLKNASRVAALDRVGNGVLEYWSIGVLEKTFFWQYSITPSLHYSGSLRLADGTIKS